MRIFRLTISILLVALASGCTSPSNLSEQKNCDRHTNLQCANAALASTEKIMEEVFQHVADTQEEESIKRLGVSQRNWAKYRDSYVEFISAHAPDEKTFALLSINQRIDMALARTAELHRQLSEK